MLKLHVGDRIVVYSAMSMSGSSSDASVLAMETLDHLGYLRAVKAGSATVNLSYDDGSSQTISVTVS